MKSENIAKIDKYFRPIVINLPPKFVVRLYSLGRNFFLNQLYSEKPKIYNPPEHLKRKLWDIDFASPLFNAAGMFKTGEGYYMAAAQGAGAFLAGTSTSVARVGNNHLGIKRPFTPYPLSKAASNWMGLPNIGHNELAKRLANIEKIKNCPLGISVAASLDETGIIALEELVKGLEYYDKSGVDFIELNESCPNVPHECQSVDFDGIDTHLIERLEFISSNFLKKRSRKLPVIVKFSNDLNLELLPSLLEILTTLEFDGVNFGNTSTDYDYCRKFIENKEQKLFNYFINNFGGGVSGQPLKNRSLELSKNSIVYLSKKQPSYEFHIIRTGGIDSPEDLVESDKAGIVMNQWFTGYFDYFSRYGHDLYKYIYSLV
jgi:dihydroorotate dehydrogenase